MTLHISGFENEREVETYSKCVILAGRDLARGDVVLIKTLAGAYTDVAAVRRLQRE